MGCECESYLAVAAKACVKAQCAVTAEKHSLAVILAEQLKINDLSIEMAFKFECELCDLIHLYLCWRGVVENNTFISCTTTACI